MTDDHSQHDNQSKQRIVEDIEKYSCHIALLEPDNYLPGFAYTIGLYEKFGHPEIICFGLPTNVMGSVLNTARDIVKQGGKITTTKQYPDFLNNYNVEFINVDKEFYANYFGYAGCYYNMTFNFPVLQLVWPDKQNKFPWDKDFNPDWKFKQPLLDRNTDFKFYEERNVAVFTTKQAFEGQPILFVYHNENGDWQFQTSELPDIQDSMVVALENITKLDPTINEIYHLQYGWRAWRKSTAEDWQYEKYLPEE
jgi:hypothetical protein